MKKLTQLTSHPNAPLDSPPAHHRRRQQSQPPRFEEPLAPTPIRPPARDRLPPRLRPRLPLLRNSGSWHFSPKVHGHPTPPTSPIARTLDADPRTNDHPTPPRHTIPLSQRWTLPSEFALLRRNAAPAPGGSMGRDTEANVCAKGFPSSSSRSPASSAAPVRFHDSERENAHAMEEDVNGEISRLPRWRDPGPRRVHGRHHPLHHPQRQGPRYDATAGIRRTWTIGRLTLETQFARTTFCACSSLSVRPGG